MLQMQETMFPAQPKRAKRPAAQVPIKHILVKHLVMLLMREAMFRVQPKPVKRPVQLERSALVKDQFRVQTLLLDTTCHLLASRVQQHAVPVPIKQIQVKHLVVLPISVHMYQQLAN